MEKQKIIDLLEKCEHSEQFASYIIRLETERDAKGEIKNKWFQGYSEEQMVALFNRVSEDGLVFDGKHITLQSTGISYDYVAYKNKMLLAYPESKVDLSIVYTDDDFSVAKESGNIVYTHNIKSPFGNKEENIVGGYCVIKNKRGEFLTLLSKEDIEKHRKTAKTDYIWKAWPVEMTLKTIIKKAVKQHFADVFEKIEDKDNDNYSLENPLELSLAYKQAIDDITTIEELKAYYEANKGQGKDFDQYITMRKSELSKEHENS